MTAAALANLIAYSAQVLIVVAAGAVSALLIRLPNARGRLAYWRLVLAVCLAVPLLALPIDRIVFVPQSAIGGVPTPAAIDMVELEPEPALSAPVVVTWLLVAGAAVRLAWLGIGILALARLRRQSEAAVLSDAVEVLRTAVAPAASIRWQATVAQPVAFGWLRPVVLLPRRVADLPLDAQRAVVCHELLHVARHDWVWMLGEEAVRSLFWFHPAIWFAFEKLQLSREELVDEEVVRITRVKQPYVRALAMFAGEPTAFAAATPFIRRGHLVSRIRRLSEVRTMSRLRIVSGFVTLLLVIVASGWVAMAAVPLRAAKTTLLTVPRPAEPVAHLLPPVDPAVSAVERQLMNQDAAAAQSREVLERAVELATRLQAAKEEALGDGHTGERFRVSMQSVAPALTQKVAPVYPEAAKGHGVEALVTVGVTIGAGGEVMNVEVVRTRLTTEHDITDPGFWASQPSTLFGQAAEDAVRQWRFQPISAPRRFEVAISFNEHERLDRPVGRSGVRVSDPASGGVVTYTPTMQMRVGGAIRQPAMVSKVEPAYPAAAKVARVEGTVLVELTIGTDGAVREARVLRSIPLLDQVALDAVRRWRYEPTLLNGAPVEVISVVAVGFRLP